MINLKKFKNHNNEIKMAIINFSIKKLKKNYYDSRAKKVTNLIRAINTKGFKRSTLGGCIFFKRGTNLCLKNEKLWFKALFVAFCLIYNLLIVKVYLFITI